MSLIAPADEFSLEDLGLAYRKAKVDLYYSTNAPLLAIADYEECLLEKLAELQAKINGGDKTWVEEKDFLGDWTLVPKSIKTITKDKDSGLIFASPDEEWQVIVDSGNKPEAEFRLMARCSLDFHVLSALWMLKVGAHFDKKLSVNVYGSRLRRNRFEHVNENAIGSFEPYLKPFRDWRDNGIKAMSEALADKKKVLALTADVSSFFHELNPGFMLDKNFQELIGVNLDARQEKLHRLFISALQQWAKNTPLGKGLPVGLPASALVANTALFKLDQFIEHQVVPLYYGRYVDDILLVMENTSKINNAESFWNWIFSRDGGNELFGKDGNEADGKEILFKPDYLENDNSRIAFTNSKNKLFILSGNGGVALINAIAEQIHQRASEWRALPVLPESAESVATDLVKATNHVGEQADNLRKTDALTLHRAGFALSLRDYEAYERDLQPDDWKDHRHALFDAVITHVLTPVKFFELAQYLPRIVQMAVACEDFEYIERIVTSLDGLINKVNTSCLLSIKASNYSTPDAPECWKKTLHEAVSQSLISAFPPELSKKGKLKWKELLYNLKHDSKTGTLVESWLLTTFAALNGDVNQIQKAHARLFSSDLAHIPLRFIGLPREMVRQRGIPKRDKLTLHPEALALFANKLEELESWLKLKHGVPAGLYFSTRPLSLHELYLIAPDPFNAAQNQDQNSLGKVMLALRGFELTEHKMPRWDKFKRVLQIPDGDHKDKLTIAVSSWKTTMESYVASVMRKPDPDGFDRYQRLNHLINRLISRPDNSGYLVLPELSIPPQWFMRIAGKLKGRGISLIAGVEYLHAPRKRVRNQLWASLTHDGLGFPSLMLYRQDKQRPALHEEQELFRLAGIELTPAIRWQQPPVIQHGNFRFSMLVCSELTNIRYRAGLRGKIDALFVSEWNKDTETFNALVESAALDMHAYIIQCNDRQYGDSRIRAPFKESWQRDVLRVKGGVTDYCVIGEINIHALREFQSSYRSSAKGFKPVPDGFAADMAYDRKVLPKGE